MMPTGLKYLGGKSWAEVTREERVFCQHLYVRLVRDLGAKNFVQYLNDEVVLEPTRTRTGRSRTRSASTATSGTTEDAAASCIPPSGRSTSACSPTTTSSSWRPRPSRASTVSRSPSS